MNVRWRRLFFRFSVVLVLVVGVAMSAAAFAIYSDPARRDALAAAADLATLMRHAEDDPGAIALREAGCDTAHAYASDEFAAILRRIDPTLRDRAPSQNAPMVVVACTSSDPAPRCEALAGTFVDAHRPPPTSFALSLSSAANDATICSGVFTERGRRVRAIDPHDDHSAPAIDVRTSATRRPD